jgi:hypothetical protein
MNSRCTLFIFSSLAIFAISHVARGAHLIPSRLDPKLSEAREKAFIPWSTPEESSASWKKLSSSNVPIYNERKPGNLSRDIYIPNPGTGYWVLGGLSEKALWKTQGEKLEIGDELVSASVYKDDKGLPVYWALWAPKDRADLLKGKMRELGIFPAKVELTLLDRVRQFSADITPYSGAAVVMTLVFQFILIVLAAVLLIRLQTPPRNQ